MSTIRQRLRRLRFPEPVGLFTALTVALVGSSFVWNGPGERAVRLREEVVDLHSRTENLRDEMAANRERFLAGEEAELLLSLFEERATPSHYIGAALDDLGLRRIEGVEVVSMQVEEPERTSSIARVGFSIGIHSPFQSVISFARWLEEAYPAFQVNELTMERTETKPGVRTVLSGALFMPR